MATFIDRSEVAAELAATLILRCDRDKLEELHRLLGQHLEPATPTKKKRLDPYERLFEGGSDKNFLTELAAGQKKRRPSVLD